MSKCDIKLQKLAVIQDFIAIPTVKKNVKPPPKSKGQKKRGRGRPKNSKNKNHRDAKLNAKLTQTQGMLLK